MFATLLFSHYRPPTVTAPAPLTMNGTSNSPTTPVTLPPPTSQTCAAPPCNVTIVINGTTYLPGQTVNLPTGSTTPITYVITDSQGRNATSPTNVTVSVQPYVPIVFLGI